MKLVRDLDTPSVTVDLHIMEANLSRVQAHLSKHGIGNRPHIKTPQDPGARQDADAGRRHRHHLPEAGRGRGVRRCRRRRRRAADLQHRRLAQDRAADPAQQAHQEADRRVRQRGGGARHLRGGEAARRHRALPGRVRHRLRPQRRAVAAGGVRPRAHRDEAAGPAVRGPDELPQRPQDRRVLHRGAVAVQDTRASRSRSCRAAARRHCSRHRTCRC